jgi:hypothetical protein
MIKTFENDSDVILYAFEIIASIARDNQYLIIANCVWWIAGIIELDERLKVHIDKLISERELNNRGISSTPRGIARAVSPDSITKEIPTARNSKLSKRQRRTLL